MKKLLKWFYWKIM